MFEEKKKNKWISQSLRKRHNKIQKAHVKQRINRKKFQSQRFRKNVVKQMGFDFNDFVLQNQMGNCKRMQVRPTIGYHHCNDIQCLDDSYYSMNHRLIKPDTSNHFHANDS